MRLSVHIPLLLLCLAASGLCAQHTPITSQYLFNGLLINPAYAGSRDALTANITHRQQWLGFEGAPVTQVLSIHSPVNNKKIGLGLMVFNDRIGVSRETGVTTNYAYRVRLGNGKLSLGLGLGFLANRSNWQDVAVQQQSDVSFQPVDRSAIRPNFSSGAFYYTKRSFIGLSFPFMLGQRDVIKAPAHQRSMNMQPMLFAGHVFDLSERVKLKPTTLLRYTAGAGLQGDVSTNFIFHEKLWLGASYRSNDALVAMLEILPRPQWRIGYSYDMGITSIRRYHAGSHEMMLQYEFGYRIKLRDPRYF